MRGLTFLSGLAAMLVSGALAARLPDVTCPSVCIPPVGVQVLDQFGRDATLGASISFQRTRAGRLIPRPSGDFADGTDLYRVTVKKRWYGTVVRSNIPVRVGSCGVKQPTTVRVVLRLVPDAPPVRSVTVSPVNDYTGGKWPQWDKLRAVVDANPGVNPAATWTTSDPALASVSGVGLVRSKRCVNGSGGCFPVTVMATARADGCVARRTHLVFGRPTYGRPTR